MVNRQFSSQVLLSLDASHRELHACVTVRANPTTRRRPDMDCMSKEQRIASCAWDFHGAAAVSTPEVRYLHPLQLRSAYAQ